MELCAQEALVWTKRLIGGAVALQTLELWSVRAALREDGVFRWSVLRTDFRALPAAARAALDALLGYRGFRALLALQLAAASSLTWFDAPVLARVLLATTWLVCVRFRGSYNGGSDAMTWAVLLGLVIAESSPALRPAGLGYIAAQLTLSYFVAGMAKLRDRGWRGGRALAELSLLPQYAAPSWAQSLCQSRAGAILGWLVLVFECAFPLAFCSLPLCLLFANVGLVFHLMNALVLGLNRFLWAWLAAYPALVFWSACLRL